MKMMTTLIAVALLAGLAGSTDLSAADDKKAQKKGGRFVVTDIDGNKVNLRQKYKGKVMLVVNVASRCGYTKHYTGLQQLHEQYGDKGLAVLGFPCNQFGGQEPGTEEEIKTFCQTNYNVKFDLFSKIEVKGDNAAPLYKMLTSAKSGLDDTGDVKWNFEKFLVGKDGKVIARYRSKVKPEDIASDIEKALAAK